MQRIINTVKSIFISKLRIPSHLKFKRKHFEEIICELSKFIDHVQTKTPKNINKLARIKANTIINKSFINRSDKTFDLNKNISRSVIGQYDMMRLNTVLKSQQR